MLKRERNRLINRNKSYIILGSLTPKMIEIFLRYKRGKTVALIEEGRIQLSLCENDGKLEYGFIVTERSQENGNTWYYDMNSENPKYLRSQGDRDAYKILSVYRDDLRSTISEHIDDNIILEMLRILDTRKNYKFKYKMNDLDYAFRKSEYKEIKILLSKLIVKALEKLMNEERWKNE